MCSDLQKLMFSAVQSKKLPRLRWNSKLEIFEVSTAALLRIQFFADVTVLVFCDACPERCTFLFKGCGVETQGFTGALFVVLCGIAEGEVIDLSRRYQDGSDPVAGAVPVLQTLDKPLVLRYTYCVV
jgi:hypothetical protein